MNGHRAPRVAPARRAVTLALPLVAAVAAALVGAQDARADDPALTFRSIETEHFRITYHLEVERLARRLAVVAEDAHQKLVPVLGHATRDRVEVALIDTVDSPNGFTYAFPYPHVTLFATAPDDRSELNDYDDWLSELFMHEYTHVLHLDTIHGIARVVNYLLGFGERGRVLLPNQYQPRFLIEGLAVFEETTRSSAGRLRSSIYDMWLRAAALEGRLLRLDEVSSYPIAFPRGGVAYLYGSAFLRYLVARLGADTLRRMSHEYGGSWVPGGINRALRRVSGHTLTELYEPFREALVARYRAVAASVEGAGLTRARVLTGYRDYAARPTFTPDGRAVVWADSDGYSRTQLRMVEPAGAWDDPRAPAPTPRTLHLVDAVGGSTFSRDGRTLYFSATDVYRTVYQLTDLYALDVASGVRRRLTEGLRAEDPDLSPDGATLAFVVNDHGVRKLATMPASGGGAPRILVEDPGDLSQAYTPAWSPDGRRIAFSWWRDGGMRDIWIADAATGALERVTADRALDVDPRFSPDGRWLYFSSDRSGIYDLYAFELATRRTFQVTNVLGGVFDVAISPDGARAAYVGFEARGWRLEAIALAPSTWREAPAPVPDRPEPAVAPGVSTAPAHDYQPWRTMWPRTLAGSSYPDSFGQVVALRLGGSDLLDHHRWDLSVGASLARADDVSFSIGYTYRRFFPTLSLIAGRGLSLRRGLFVNGRERAFVEDDYVVSGGASLPVIRTFDHASDLALSCTFAYLRDTGSVRVPLDPNDITPRRPDAGALSMVSLSWSFSNARRFLYSVSAETGRSIGLTVSASLKAIGSRADVYTASWYWAEYFRMPWLRSHALAAIYRGGVSGGNPATRGAFYVGGYAPQSDILRAVFDFSRPGGASLRGYPYGVIHGDQYHVVNLEYRFPIAWIERGYETLPIYLQRLQGAAFVDAGNAFYGPFRAGDLRLGAGAELRIDLQYGYFYSAALQLGYAHGFMKDGGDQVYFLLNNPF